MVVKDERRDIVSPYAMAVIVVVVVRLVSGMVRVGVVVVVEVGAEELRLWTWVVRWSRTSR